MANTNLFLCMKWGARYGAEYANRLYRSIARNMGGEPFQLVCFTDDARGVLEEVDCRPLPDFPGVPEHLSVKPWKKLCLWKADLGDDLLGRDALFLDLDLVIVGDLRDFFTFEPGRYVVWENPTKLGSGVGNTSIFRFKVGSHPEIYERFVTDAQGFYEHEFRIEQEFISARLGDGRATQHCALTPVTAADPFYTGLGEQRFWPKGWCVSFKEDVLPSWPVRFWKVPTVPSGAKVVVFHGKPDPDEAMVGKWPAKSWKKLYKYIRPVPWIAENWA